MKRPQRILGILGCILGTMGGVRIFYEAMGISMMYGVGAASNHVTPQHFSANVFILPVLAIIMEIVVFFWNCRRGYDRATFWIAGCGATFSALLILLALQPT